MHHTSAGEDVTFLESVEEAVYEMLARGYECLFQEGSKEGHWREVRSTALTALALRLRESGDSVWLHSAKKWMQKVQVREGRTEGSWGDEVWDTAMCVIALRRLGVSPKDSSVQKGLMFTSKLYPVNGRNNWHDEPWETSWALIAILLCFEHQPPEVRISSEDVVAAVGWLMSLQDPDGRIVAPHYTAYFLLVNHLLDKIELEHSERKRIWERAQRAGAYLLATLEQSSERRLWTGEAWSNGQILWALVESGLFPVSNRNLLTKTCSWFESAQDQRGAWVDIEDTASAIIGLFSLLESVLSHKETFHEHRGALKDEMCGEIRRRAPTPRLLVKRPLIERQRDIGGISINLDRTKLAVISSAGLVLTLLVTLRNELKLLIDFFRFLVHLWEKWL
jgi:hypothetical protein